MVEYVNIDKHEILKPIYRIISFDRLVRIFQSGQMTFAKPEKWDDPFENYISKTRIDNVFNFKDIGVRRHSHGTCWTRRSVSDAMWRIYSHDKKAVRIRSTPETVGRNVGEGLEKYQKSKLFIGKVEYLTTLQIRKKAKEYAKRMVSGNLDRAAAESLLFKRNSFSHEEEVRVLIIDQDDISVDGLINIDIDPHNTINGVMIDSRAPTELYDVYKSYLEDVLEFKGSISRSTLYDVPKPIIVKYKIKRKIKIKRKEKLKR